MADEKYVRLGVFARVGIDPVDYMHVIDAPCDRCGMPLAIDAHAALAVQCGRLVAACQPCIVRYMRRAPDAFTYIGRTVDSPWLS